MAQMNQGAYHCRAKLKSYCNLILLYPPPRRGPDGVERYNAITAFSRCQTQSELPVYAVGNGGDGDRDGESGDAVVDSRGRGTSTIGDGAPSPQADSSAASSIPATANAAGRAQWRI